MRVVTTTFVRLPAVSTYSFELFIPDRERKRTLAPSVPFHATVPQPGWPYEEGEIRWIIDGVTLVDKDAGLYPADQVADVLAFIGIALSRRSGSRYLSGSIVQLLTEPVDRNRAKFILDIKARRVTQTWGNKAEHREVVANIRKTARSVLDSVASMLAHLDASVPPHPEGVPPLHGYGRDGVAWPIRSTEEAYEAFLRPQPKRRSR